jgi:DNA-binding NtrC family response regulator
LLRVLQEREVQPLGADKTQPVDVRVIAATNRDMAAQVAAGKFRTDLYYRLNVVPLMLPPLRERRLDIAPLAAHFARRKQRKFTPAALETLQRHPWPGNVRELENLVERLSVLRPSGDLEVDEPSAAPAAPAASLPPEGVNLYAVLGELEDRLIGEALDRAQGNRQQAARYLGLNRTTLVEKLRKMSRR